ncbi:hypothetical protein SASPL_150410 [Salvia splendens]|uniref:Uncharacterized protein n=1 Tax=Salvia splendens TaxID=180675 RepID=A0A8X8W660_SALSN|nr:hypothetical protein SASPL_150410 [Salvia splendens]
MLCFHSCSLVKLGDLEEAKAVLDDWTSTCYTYDFRVPDILLTGYLAKSLSHLSNKLETALELTKTMARRAASKARELKWIRWDMAFKQERSGLLEEENKKLRDGLFGKAWRSRRSKAVLDDWTSTCHTYDFAEHTADGILSKGAIDLPRHLLLEHSYQLHAMIVENKKPKKVALPEIRAEVDQIGYDIMQQRCGCACVWKYHHLTSHYISSSYESLLWGMRFDFSSPQKGVEDETDNDMARRAASKARDLKWIRWDMAFMQQRSGLLEEENMKLRDGHLGDKYRLSFPKAIDFPRLLEHSYQPHDMIVENKKPKECCEAVDHAKRLEEDPMLLLRGLSCCPFGSLWFMDLVLVALPEIRAEVDHIGHDIMQERCGCACIVEYHHLTSHDMSSSYESLLWGMQFDFSSPQKADIHPGETSSEHGLKTELGDLEEAKALLDDFTSTTSEAIDLLQHLLLLLEHSNQLLAMIVENKKPKKPHDMIVENQKPKKSCEAVDHAKRLEEDSMILLKGEEDGIDNAFMQERSGLLEEENKKLHDGLFEGYHAVHLDSIWFIDLALVALPEIRCWLHDQLWESGQIKSNSMEKSLFQLSDMTITMARQAASMAREPMWEDSVLLLRGFDSLDKFLSHLSNNLETALEHTITMARRAASKAREPMAIDFPRSSMFSPFDKCFWSTLMIVENQKLKRVVKQLIMLRDWRRIQCFCLEGYHAVHLDSLWFMDLVLVALPEIRLIHSC